MNTITKVNGQFVLTKDDKTTALLVKKTSDGYLHIPADVAKETNVRLVKITKIETAGTHTIEPKPFKEPRRLSPRPNDGATTTRKSVEEYLDDADRKLFNELKAKAEAAREEAKKVELDPLTKAERALKNAQATVERLRNEAIQAKAAQDRQDGPAIRTKIEVAPEAPKATKKSSK